jgi:hypothetical protein
MRSNIDSFVHVSFNLISLSRAFRVPVIDCLLWTWIGCNLVVGYETTPQRRAGPYTYILDGALTEQQGSFS